MGRSVAFVGCVTLAVMACHAQTSLTGYVREGDEGMFAANVFLKGHPDAGTVTDEEGYFELSLTDDMADDTLVVRYLGYEDFRAALSALDNPCVIRLSTNKEGLTLSEVVVKADVTAGKEFATDQLDKMDIYMMPAASADPLKAVRLQAYSTSTTESATPELRGSYGDDSRVMVNGVPVIDPVRNRQLNGMGNFSLFSAEMIGKLLVYPGNPPLEYGNAIGGIVDIRTTDNLLKRQETNVSLSLATAGVFHSRQINDKSFVQVYGNHQWSSLYKSLNKSALDYLDHFRSTDAGVNGRVLLSRNSYINGYAYVIKERYESAREMYNYAGRQRARSVRNFDILNYRLWSDNGVFGVNMGWDINDSEYRFAHISDSTLRKSFYVSASYKRHFPLRGLTVSVGADYEHHGYRFRDTRPAYIYNMYGSGFTRHEGNVVSNKYESFLYVKWEVGKLSIGASVRQMSVPDMASRFSVQASARYSFSASHALILAFGKYDALTMPDYHTRETGISASRQVSLDWKFMPMAGLELSAALYGKRERLPLYHDYANATLLTGHDVLGMELSAKYTWGHLEFSGSYSHINAEARCLGVEYPADNDFRHLAKGQVSYLDPATLNVSFSLLYRGGLPYTPIVGSENGRPLFGKLNGHRYNDYLSLDLSVNKYIPLGGIAIVPFLTITNLTDRKNHQYHYYSEDYAMTYTRDFQRRLVYVGCVVRF